MRPPNLGMESLHIMTSSPDDRIDPAILRLMQRMAWSFCASNPSLTLEPRDVAQRLGEKFAAVRHRYDTTRPGAWLWLKQTFRRECNTLRRECRAQKRAPQIRPQSLNRDAIDADGRVVDFYQVHPHPTSRDEVRRRDLQIDMREVSRVDPAVRRMLEEAQHTGRRPTLVQFRQVSRRLGDREIERLRRLFEDRGLRDYLG